MCVISVGDELWQKIKQGDVGLKECWCRGERDRVKPQDQKDRNGIFIALVATLWSQG